MLALLVHTRNPQKNFSISIIAKTELKELSMKIEPVTTAKDLGIYIDKSLNYNDHIDKSKIENQTVELVRALPQDPKVLCDSTRIVSMLFSHVVADYRSFVFLHTLI